MAIPPFVNFILIVFLFLGEAFLFVSTQRISKALRGIFGNKEEKDIFEVLLRQEEKNKELAKELQKLTKGCVFTAEIASQSIQRVGIVRFNPFHSTGGDQSFSLALLDRDNNGVVITSLHANDMTRVYAKPVQNGGSEQQLSREEEKAILAASQQNKT